MTFGLTLIGALVLSAAAASNAAAQSMSAARLEMIDWLDPERALQIVDSAPPEAAELDSSQFEMLEIRGTVFINNNRIQDAEAVLRRLDAAAGSGDRAAARAAHYVHAYLYSLQDRFPQAQSEIQSVDMGSIRTDTERYRILMFQGYVLRLLGQDEAALPPLRRSMDLATDMRDDLRILCARLAVGRVYMDSGDFERASAEAEAARRLATELREEGALADAWEFMADIADQRGDSAEERNASLVALQHARRSGSSKWLSLTLVSLSDSYLKSDDYAESLKYSKQALPIIQQRNDNADVQWALFDEGLAYIGLGRVKEGRKLAEGAVDQTLASGNLLDGRELLREYANSLERAGYLMMAIGVHHRYKEVSDKFMTNSRQRAFLELSARFDDERKAAELELLRRDNALKASELRGQQLHQQLILAWVLFITAICAALLWAFARVHRANERLRFSSEHDALTGLSNRRYFSERVLAMNGGRPFAGCVLLADLDHFKRINDTFGHPAGDAVLAAVSRRMSMTLRETDTLVRWGGEEFLAVLGPMTPRETDSTIERLMQAVRLEPVVWHARRIHCTISIGYATFPMDRSKVGMPLGSAIKLADDALYEAKRRGRDRACLIRLAGDDARETSGLTSKAEEWRTEFTEIRGAAA